MQKPGLLEGSIVMSRVSRSSIAMFPGWFHRANLDQEVASVRRGHAWASCRLAPIVPATVKTPTPASWWLPSERLSDRSR